MTRPPNMQPGTISLADGTRLTGATVHHLLESRTAQLTVRQCDVLKLLCAGLPNKRIARHLGIAYATVKVHVSAILKALDATNRTEAVIRARERGFMGQDAHLV